MREKVARKRKKVRLMFNERRKRKQRVTADDSLRCGGFRSCVR